MKIALISLRDSLTPPIGLVYLATEINRKNKFKAEIIDINFDDVVSKAVTGKYDVIGFTAMTVDYQKVIDCAKTIRKYTNTPFMIGGVHISTLPSSLHPIFDYHYIGEAEEYKNLDTIHHPDWSLINKQYFKHDALTTWGEFGKEGVLLTSRGCPYKCSFCSTTQFWGSVRKHSPEWVGEAIRDMVEKYGITHIQIWDDLFTLDKPRLRAIAKIIKREGWKVKFNCQPRANLIDDELCEILVSMNVKICLFGFESGNNRVLRILKGDNVTVFDNMKAIRICNKHGLKVQGSLIFGSPTESLNEMRDTLRFIDFAIENKVHRLWSFIMTPFPGTKMWAIAKERGKVNDYNMDWNILSHQNIDNPLLLDDYVNKDKFKEIFLEGRKKLNHFKWNKAISFFKDNPIETIKYGLKIPLNNLFTTKEK